MPFTKFTITELEGLLRRFPLSAEARAFVDAALKEPSRNVQGTTRNMVSEIQCPKMDCFAQSESGTVERPAVLDYIFNEDVLGYLDQAPLIELDYVGKGGRRARTPYRCDFLVFYRSRGCILEEWKPSDAVETLPLDRPGRYELDQSGHLKSPPAEKAAAKLGLAYTVRTADEIPEARFLNYKHLFSYLESEAEAINRPKLLPLIAVFRNCSFLGYQEALERAQIDADGLNWALAHGHVTIDFDHVRLTQPQEVIVFRDATTLEAYRVAAQPSSRAAQAPFTPDLFRPGRSFVFDGRRLRIHLVGFDNLHASDENNQYISLPLRQIESAYLKGELVLDRNPDDTHLDRHSRLTHASPAQIEAGLKKLRILQKEENGEALTDEEEQYSDRSLRRWRARVAQAAAAGLSAIEALIDNRADQGFHGPHIDPALSADIDRRIDQALRSTAQQTLNAIYSDIEKGLKAIGKQMVAKSSFYERVKKIRTIGTIRDSRGHKNAYREQPCYWMLEQNTPVHCERPLELVHIDHTLLEIELHSSISGEPLGRPWLSLAVDALSRRILGFYLSFHAPSYVSSMMVLLDLFYRFGRRPEALIHDWGSDFRAKDFNNLVTAARILARHWRPKSAAKVGAVIERLFGFTNTALIANLLGNTKARKDVRSLTRQIDPSKYSGLTLANLYYGLEQFFFEEYDDRKHPALLRSPRAVYEDARLSDGERLNGLIRVDDILPMALPTVRGASRTIDASRGIYVNYDYYGHPRLTDLRLDGTKAIVKSVPFHPGYILAFADGEWLTCKSKFYGELQTVPEFVRRSVYEEWLLEQRLVALDHKRFSLSVSEILDKLNAKTLANRKAWEDQDTRDLYRHFGTVVSAAPQTNTDKTVDALQERFSQAFQAAKTNDNYGELVHERRK